MTYTHENLTLNVTTLNPDYIDYMGETVLTLDSDFVAELVENCCAFVEFFLQYQYEELWDELDRDEDAIIKHFKDLNESVEITNSDAIIAVYEYCLYEDRNFSLDVSTENISWAIHDTLHAIHDTSGCTIYVESSIEKERILKSLEITKDLFPNQMPNWDFLDNLENEYHSRFNERIDLEEFKQYEDEY